MIKTLMAAIAVAFLSTAAVAGVSGHTDGERAAQNTKTCDPQATTEKALEYFKSLTPEQVKDYRIHFFQDKDIIAKIIDALDELAGSVTDHDAYDTVAIIHSPASGKFLIFAYKDGCQVTQRGVEIPEEIFALIEKLDGPST